MVQLMEKQKTEVTEVEFVPIKPRQGLVGFVSCVVDGKLYLGGIGVHTVLNGDRLRMTYPTRKVGNVNIPLYHPVNAEAGEAIREAITRKVKELMGDTI